MSGWLGTKTPTRGGRTGIRNVTGRTRSGSWSTPGNTRLPIYTSDAERARMMRIARVQREPLTDPLARHYAAAGLPVVSPPSGARLTANLVYRHAKPIGSQRAASERRDPHAAPTSRLARRPRQRRTWADGVAVAAHLQRAPSWRALHADRAREGEYVERKATMPRAGIAGTSVFV